MDQTQFQHFTDTLQTTLAADPRVLALVAIGSLAHTKQVDRWSDHDFWVVTTTEAQNDFLSDLAWLPNAPTLALILRPAHQYYSVLYACGHMAEFAVFGPHDLTRGRLTDYRLLFDKQDINARLQAIAVQVNHERQNHANLSATFGHFLMTLCTGVGRAARGECLSAYTYIFQYAVDALLQLITQHIPPSQPARGDGFDPRRRFERLYPELNATLMQLWTRPPMVAAEQLLDLAEALFPKSMLDLSPQAIATTRATIEQAQQNQAANL